MGKPRKPDYDPQCETLAGYFLTELPPKQRTKKALRSLAEAIQQAVDDWFDPPDEDWDYGSADDLWGDAEHQISKDSAMYRDTFGDDRGDA